MKSIGNQDYQTRWQNVFKRENCEKQDIIKNDIVNKDIVSISELNCTFQYFRVKNFTIYFHLCS